MLIGIITAVAFMYCISYCAHTASKKRPLGTFGALLLSAAGISAGVFLWLYIR